MGLCRRGLLCQGIVQLRWLSKLLGALFLSEREWMMFAVINYQSSVTQKSQIYFNLFGGQESKSSSLDLSQGCHESFEAVGESQCLTSSCWRLLGAAGGCWGPTGRPLQCLQFAMT